MARKTIAQVREEFQAATLQALPAFVCTYETDSRAGVQKLVAQAKKQMEKMEAERARVYKMGEYERQYAQYTYVCGVDEAGRGPLAGPVVAGAVIMEQAVAAGIGIVPQQRIDEVNILNATYEAMRQAINNLGIIPDILLNDAVTIPGISMRQVPIIKGDAKSSSIAAASILAKVTRDHMMQEYDSRYPGYGFAAHKGYGTKEHMQALRQQGPCDIHRKTFLKFLSE